jgi:hypothetical protein
MTQIRRACSSVTDDEHGVKSAMGDEYGARLFLEYQSSYIYFKTILYSRWARCEQLKRRSMTEENRRRDLLINANQLTPFYIVSPLF